MQPMGIVVIGGLLLGTLVTLVLIPCFYCIVKRVKFAPVKKNGSSGGTAELPDGTDSASGMSVSADGSAVTTADVSTAETVQNGLHS